jgi:cell division protein FtsL
VSSFMQWVTHGIKRGRFEVSRRTALDLFAVVFVLTLVAVLYLMLVSQTAARGRRIEQLRRDLAWLEKENEHIEVQIADESSISSLVRRAVENGFIQVGQVEYVYPTGEEP